MALVARAIRAWLRTSWGFFDELEKMSEILVRVLRLYNDILVTRNYRMGDHNLIANGRDRSGCVCRKSLL